MQFIYTKDPKIGITELFLEISRHLKEEKKVVWLVPGGSNIPYSVDVLSEVKTSVSSEPLQRLTVSLTDERFGDVGHKDSNWQQLLDAGFVFPKGSKPALQGKFLNETVIEYERYLQQKFEEADVVIGQFGIGADGHIVGMLPFSDATSSENLVCGYTSDPYIRITLTPKALKHVKSAYVFASGQSKWSALAKLNHENLSIEEEPSQILKQLSQARIYSDYESESAA